MALYSPRSSRWIPMEDCTVEHIYPKQPQPTPEEERPTMNQLPCQEKRKTKCPSKACVFAVLCMWQFVTLVAIIVCGVLFLKPYIRVSRYRPATCRVENSFYTNQYLCSCGFHCNSLYPCLVVHVSINTTKKLHTMALYTDDLHQSNVYEEKYDKEQACSIQVCSPDELQNRAEVNAFHTQYGVRDNIFPCFYDPNSADWGVVIRVVMPYRRVVYAMVWPTAFFLLGFLVCVIFCRRCRTYTRPEPSSANPENAEKVQLQPLTGGDTTAGVKTNNGDQKADTSVHKEGNGKRNSKKNKNGKRDKIIIKVKGVSETATDAEVKPWL